MQLRKFLIVRADGEVRVVSKAPRLRFDEFAYRLIVTIPDTWSSIVGELTLTMPEPNIPPKIEVDRTPSKRAR